MSEDVVIVKAIKVYLCDEKREAEIRAGAEPEKGEIDWIRLKDFPQLTVAEYARIMDKPEHETQQDMVARVFGIDRWMVMGMSLQNRNDLIGFYKGWMKESAAMWARSKQLHERLAAIPEEQDGKPWDAQQARAALEDVQMFRTSFEVDGRTFRVPELIEQASKLGQWITAKDMVADHAKSGAPEWKLWPKMLACFCLEDGDPWPMQRKDEEPDDWDLRFAQWWSPRAAFFEQAKVIDAMCINAFFFSSSNEFHAITHLSMRSFWSLLWPLKKLMPTPTANAGEPSAST